MQATLTARGRAVRRAVVALTIATALIGIVDLPVVGASDRGRGEAPVDQGVVVAAEGDTLWELALPYAPAGADPHEWVAEVAAHNDMTPGQLRVGEAVRIPHP